MRSSSLFNKLKSCSLKFNHFFFEALFFQLIAGLLLKIVPFKNIPRLFPNPSRLKSPNSPLPSHLSHLNSHISPLSIEDLKTATQHASKLSPWKNKCMVQALAARRMMTRRGIPSRLSLGVTFDEDKKMKAHAWLTADDIEVVEKNGNYLEIYYF